MPKANEDLTTTAYDQSHASEIAVAASEAVASSGPSILEFGQHLARLEVAYELHDIAYVQQAKDQSKHKDAKALLFRRIEAIRAAIGTMPATSLADAAVQVALCASMAGVAMANAAAPGEVDDIERMLLGVVPILAAAAGLDMVDMDWVDQDALRVRRFAGVGVQS